MKKYIGRELIKERVFRDDEIEQALKEYVRDAAGVLRIVVAEGIKAGLMPDAIAHLWRSSLPSFAVYLIEREHLKRMGVN
jgi:hypothetical protein